MWRVRSLNSESIGNIFLRGGSASYGPYSGIFTLAVSRDANGQDSGVWFRCSF
jgi:hypothetical protein